MPKLLVALLALGVLGCGPSRNGSSADGATPGGTTDAADLPAPVYPGAVHLGQRRVYGTDGTHITWDGFATPDAPAQVVAFYRDAMAEAGGTFEPREGGSGVWRLPDAAAGSLVLDVLPVTAPGPHQELADRIPASARTVIIVARKS